MLSNGNLEVPSKMILIRLMKNSRKCVFRYFPNIQYHRSINSLIVIVLVYNVWVNALSSTSCKRTTWQHVDSALLTIRTMLTHTKIAHIIHWFFSFFLNKYSVIIFLIREFSIVKLPPLVIKIHEIPKNTISLLWTNKAEWCRPQNSTHFLIPSKACPHSCVSTDSTTIYWRHARVEWRGQCSRSCLLHDVGYAQSIHAVPCGTHSTTIYLAKPCVCMCRSSEHTMRR